ncbi:MAG: TAXI family TRAP transporter solute-binding subunit [Planctomycetota bacterium]
MKSATGTIRRWITVAMLVVFVGSLALWLANRERLPSVVRVATGHEHGLYHVLGEGIRPSLERRLDRDVVVVTTHGSRENFEQLQSGAADLAVVQGGSVPLEEVSIVTPLAPELVFVIVRKTAGITSIPGLAGRNVSLGDERSGSRVTARRLLGHYGIDPEGLGMNEREFTDLLTVPELDAAIATAGIQSPELDALMVTGRFDLLPVDSAPAVELMSPFFRRFEIPAGVFAGRPPNPARAIPTVATNSFLICRPDAPDSLVRAALAAVHEENLRLHVPTLILRADAPHVAATRFHPEAWSYFHPTDQIGRMANVMESLAATKELLFALGAAIYLLWLRWRRLKARENEALIREQKEHLDVYLEDALRIEEAQMATDDPGRLREYLDEVTRIKLRILHEFTAEEVRGDQAFTIVVDQCGRLVGKLQQRLLLLARAP